MTLRAISGLVVLNVFVVGVGAGMLWGLRGWRSWAELVRLAGVAYLLGIAALFIARFELVIGLRWRSLSYRAGSPPPGWRWAGAWPGRPRLRLHDGVLPRSPLQIPLRRHDARLPRGCLSAARLEGGVRRTGGVERSAKGIYRAVSIPSWPSSGHPPGVQHSRRRPFTYGLSRRCDAASRLVPARRPWRRWQDAALPGSGGQSCRSSSPAFS
jgi:hypothetical protein